MLDLHQRDKGAKRKRGGFTAIVAVAFLLSSPFNVQAGLFDWLPSKSNEPIDGQAKSAVSSGLIQQAELSGSVVGLSELGLNGPKTVYVPGRYTLNGRGALWIQNRQVLPYDHPNVLGFVPAGEGYLIAGYKANDMEGPQVGFYFVDQSGNAQRLIAVLPVSKSQAWISKDAIYIARASGRFAGKPLYDYRGVTASGEHVDGPQSCLYATPMQDGAWFVQRPLESPTRARYKFAVGKWTPEAGFIPHKAYSFWADNHYVFVNTQGVHVDMAPVADSVRTGAVMVVSSAYGATGSRHPYIVGLYHINEPEIGVKEGFDAWPGFPRSVAATYVSGGKATRDYYLSLAIDLAEQAVIAGAAGSHRLIGRFEESTQRYVCFSCNPDSPSILFETMGTGLSAMSATFGGGGFRTDIVPLFSPRGSAVFVLPGAINNRQEAAGYAVEMDRAFPADQVAKWLMRYDIRKAL